MGPAKTRSAKSVPSAFLPILVVAIPSRGATRIPSVMMARPSLTARSRVFSLVSPLASPLLAYSSATLMATISLFPYSLVFWRISSATPST